MIKKRQFEIVNLILKSKGNINIKYISDLYNISDRSVRYDIDELNNFFLQKYKREIIEVVNNKPKILYSEKDLKEKIENIKIEEYSMSEEERVELLSYEIFLLKNSFILNYFSEKYSLSKSTLRQSLKKLNRNISNYSISVNIETKGYKIIGNEIDIRKYIINILRYFFKEIKEDGIKYIPYRKIAESFLSESEWEFLKNRIIDISNETDKIISDEAFETLVIFLLISRIRNKKGKIVKDDIENEQFLMKTPEFEKIYRILKNVENLHREDILYFTDFYLGSYSYNSEYSYFLNWIMIESTVDRFLEKLSININTDLNKDKILRKELLNHIKPAIYRIKNRLPLTESILEDVKNTYFELYEKTKKSLEDIWEFKNTPFDDEETAFITVMVQRAVTRNINETEAKIPNILIVCGLGYSSSRFVYERINEYFDVNIVDIIPYNQLENYDYLKKADLIISTLDFSLEGIEVIKVNALVNNKDIKKLKKYGLSEKSRKIRMSELLDFIKNVTDEESLKERLLSNFGESIYDDTGLTADNKKSFHDLISLSGIRLNVDLKDINEVVEFTGKVMYEEELVEKEYTEELREQISQYGKYILIGRKTIIPHGQLLKNVKKTGFSIIVLKKGVDFFGSEIRIVICLASRKKDEHLKAILELNGYLKKDDFEMEIINKKTPGEVMEYLKQLGKENE